jgi:predicted CoA-binding protein
MGDLGPMKATTLVLGASEKPHRYANKAMRSLLAGGHAVLAVGMREGQVDATPIHTDIPTGARIDTVTLYLSAANQAAWAQRLLALHPRRVIFNPGAENPALAQAMRAQGAEVLEACTLVMLATGQY